MIAFLAATAMGVVNAVPAFANETHRFEVAAQPASTAISAFASQARVQILVAAEKVQDKKLNAVSGELSTQEALRRLLANSGVSARYVGDRSIALVGENDSDGAELAFLGQRLRLAQSTSGDTEAARPAAFQPVDRQDAVEEVVVSAQKREERLLQVPVPVSVISGQTLGETNHVLLRDYYTSVPGISYAPNYVSQQSVAIRGITTGGLTTATTGIMVDEVPFLGYRVYDFDPGELERIEVLRGPQGTLYGASSMGGLIKYVTRQPDMARFSARLTGGLSTVRGGDDPGYQFRGSVNVPVSDTFAFSASAFQRREAGYIDNPVYDLKDVNETVTRGAQVTALWKPSDMVSLRLSSLYQRAEADGLYEGVNAAGIDRFEQNYLPGAGLSDRKVQAHSAVLNVKLGGATLTSVTGYVSENNLNSLDYSFALGGVTNARYGIPGVQFFGYPVSERFTQELRAAGTFGDRLDWLAGAFYTHEKTDEQSSLEVQSPVTGQFGERYYYSIGDLKSTEYAAFANLTYHFTDRFDVQLGGRQSKYESMQGVTTVTGLFVVDVLGGDPPNVSAETSTDESVFTYLFTPRFRLTPDVMLYGRVASGFRIGTPNRAGLGLPPGSKSDETVNYELGAKAELFDHALTLDFSAYYIDWKDIQTQGVRIFTYSANGGAAKSEGFELSLSSHPWRGTSLDGWVSYNNAVLTSPFPVDSTIKGNPGDRLPFSAHWSGNVSAEQSLALPDAREVFAGATISYVGTRYGQFTNSPSLREEYPAYTRLDLRAGLRAGSWSATAYLNNVADKRVALQGGAGYFYPLAFIYTEPRTAGLTLSWSF